MTDGSSNFQTPSFVGEETNYSSSFSWPILLLTVLGSSFSPTEPGNRAFSNVNEPIPASASVFRCQENVGGIETGVIYDRIENGYSPLQDIYDKCKKALPLEESIDVDSYNYLKCILANEKSLSINGYSALLASVMQKGDANVIKATLNFLSSLDFSDIVEMEESYLIFGLFSTDISVQECALNALLCLGNLSEKERLREVKIQNRFMQKDLDDFLSQATN